MVYRDPQTGKFRSGSSSNVDIGRRHIQSWLQYRVNAADITTGRDVFTVEGEASEIVDMSQIVDSDEMFRVHSAELSVQVQPLRTATAEHSYRIRYALAQDYAPAPAQDRFEARPTAGAVEPFLILGDDDSVWTVGSLQGTGDVADSVNGLAAGADQAQAHHVVNFIDAGVDLPHLDRDDEMALPSRIRIEGSDDQGLEVEAALNLTGQVVEED